MKANRFVPVALFTLTSALLSPSIVKAEEVVCQSTLGAVTVDNLRVPSGKTCNLNGTTVQGNIVVESNATLNANGVRVVGGVQSENAANVKVLSASTVGGSIQIKQGKAATIKASQINGDLQFESNTSRLVAEGNTIGGSLQAFQNTGGILIKTNNINGNLQCKENVPAPTGGSNVVQGVKEDQCAALQITTLAFRLYLINLIRTYARTPQIVRVHIDAPLGG